MKKSEILKILNGYVLGYHVEVDGEYKWLNVNVEFIRWEHMSQLSDYILSIGAVDSNNLEITFKSSVRID